MILTNLMNIGNPARLGRIHSDCIGCCRFAIFSFLFGGMAMQAWRVSSWEWLKARVPSIERRNRIRLRRPRTDQFPPVASEVEQLESRQLLTVTFHGGALLTNVEVQDVFLGSDWTGKSLQNQAAKLDTFASTMVQGKFADGLTLAGYNVFRGTTNAGVVDNIVLDKNLLGNINGFGGTTDSQIRSELQSMITAGTLQSPDSNRLYMVYVEPGVIINDTSNGANSVNNFLGYHSGFVGQNAAGGTQTIYYAVMAYPGFPTGGAGNSTQQLGFSFNQLTIVASHELAEAMTDPGVQFAIDTGDLTFAGWFDDNTGQEVGDIEQSVLMTFQGYLIQSIATQDETPISFNAVPQSLAAPQNLVLTAGSSASTGQLSWTSVGMAQGYRIYSIVGSQHKLLGTVDAFHTSIQLTGLPTGATSSFLVEAFDGKTFADSKVITAKAPFTLPAAAQSKANQLAAANVASAPHAPVIDHSPVHAIPALFDGTEFNRNRKRT
jgi:hypothetical protein